VFAGPWKLVYEEAGSMQIRVRYAKKISIINHPEVKEISLEES
jgi:hypothetical protein